MPRSPSRRSVALQLGPLHPVSLTMVNVARPTAQVVARPDSRLDRVGWTAFEYAPFRYFIASMLCATSGIFVFNAALGWYVLGVTGSAAAVGLIFSVSGLPILILTPQA